MSDLNKVLDQVIEEVDSMSDEELRARFEASKGGAVGMAFYSKEEAEVVLANANCKLIMSSDEGVA